MSGATDTTSEVARVLAEHYPDVTSYDAGDLHGCMGCDWAVSTGTWESGKSERDWEAFHAHQAAMLAEAGLLRRSGTDHLAEDLRENTEALMAARARLADLTARIGFGDGVTEPQADNDTIVKAVNEAMTNSNTLWEVEEQVERVRALADHYEARQGTALGRVSTGNVAASIRRALGPQEAQIATQEPAGATLGGSGDSRASEGLGERLRALVAEPDPEESQYESVDVAALVGLADEAHRLEVHARVVEQSLRTARLEGDGARIKGEQWKARYEETRDANRRVLEVAQWFRGQGQTGYARKVEEAVGGMEPETDHPLDEVRDMFFGRDSS